MTEMIVAILFYLNLLVPNQDYNYQEVNSIYQTNMEAVSTIYYNEVTSQQAMVEFQSSSNYNHAIGLIGEWEDELPIPTLPPPSM